MQVEVIRQGGIAGVRLKARVDTSELGPGGAKQAEAALEKLPFGRRAPAAGHPDGFLYEISLPDAGQRRSVVLDEAEVPEELRPLVDAALARGDLSS